MPRTKVTPRKATDPLQRAARRLLALGATSSTLGIILSLGAENVLAGLLFVLGTGTLLLGLHRLGRLGPA